MRARIDHPVIDSDGHLLEFIPTVKELFIEEAGPRRAADFDMTVDVFKATQAAALCCR